MFLFLDLGLVYTQSDRLRTSALPIVIPTRRSFVVFPLSGDQSVFPY